MKVYLLYADPAIIRACSEDDECGVKELYALTNIKSLYKDFKNTRDMNKFELRTMDLTKDEYAQLARNHRECVLQWCNFKSKKANPYPKSMNESFGNCVDEYKFSVTYLEAQSVEEACSTFFEHYELDVPNPLLFHAGLKRIFKRVGLDYVFKLTRFPYLGDDYMFCTHEEITRRSTNPSMRYIDIIFLREDMDFSMPDLWVDQLEVFLEIYGHLMKI